MKKWIFISTIVILLLGGSLVGFRTYVLYRRDPERWGEKSITYHKYCIQDFRTAAVVLQVFTENHGVCPDNLDTLFPNHLPCCPLARKHGKVGRFVYLGRGRKFTGTPYNVNGRYVGQEPVLFDYPDNHPDGGGYALLVDGSIVRFDAGGWSAFLDKHLPKDFELKDNDLRFWEW